MYKGVPVDGPPPKLDRLYVRKSRPIVERQLERGGIRLAYLLNQALAPGATTNPSR
jgi:hypothetical protein